ncbi:MAG: hypothetical protein ABI330_04845 [Caldimonas sp.]
MLPRQVNIVSLRMPLALFASSAIDRVDEAAIEAQAVSKGDGGAAHWRTLIIESSDTAPQASSTASALPSGGASSANTTPNAALANRPVT